MDLSVADGSHMSKLAPANGKYRVSSRPPQAENPASALRSALFRLGDAGFFVIVGALATLAMHYAHEWEWGFLLEMLVGMGLAMIVQMLLALLMAPLLGSIESMVPSMALAMISPMFVCILHAFGCEPGMRMTCALGAASGLGMFMFVAIYGRVTRGWLAAAFPEG